MNNQAEISVECASPDRVDAASESAFKKSVLEGGQVTPATLPALYQNALVLAFAREGGTLAGVGAIKRPSDGYRNRIFARAKANLSAAAFEYELGWVYVLPGYEGHHIASQLVRELVRTTPDAPLYATSRVSKERMHSALRNHGGFRAEGSDYLGTKEMVRLFVRTI